MLKNKSNKIFAEINDFFTSSEKGKNKKKPYGLNGKQYKSQYRKNRDKGTAGKAREEELEVNKVSNSIVMVKRALTKGINPDYLLMDSRFVCDAIIKFLTGLTTKTHLIGMAKMAKAKYDFETKQYTAKKVADIMKRIKRVTWVKPLNLYCA
ncbi:MAG: hypothetical protein JXB49_04880 [Bacteroidales bacterium]|nr:hypothetical protein [Bacteroidales bacterium]